MMTPAKIVFSLLIFFFRDLALTTARTSSVTVRQERRFVAAHVGGTVTLECFYEGDDSAWLYWYKQSFGQKPRLISTIYMNNKKITFQDEFKNSKRFTLSAEGKTNHLTISDLHTSDSATYYCACSYTFVLTFTDGTVVSVKGSGLIIPILVQQSVSETIQPGGSVTLNCTVQTRTCDGENSVYWFKSSEESNEEIIYTHGGRNDYCEREENTQTHTCIYNLSMKSLQLSHAGTYYCAVVSCGRILFGNGTKLDFEYEEGSPGLVYLLSALLTITTILVVSLAVSVFKKIYNNNCTCTESQPGCSAPSTEGHRDMENLHYAALSIVQHDRSRRQGNSTKSECVYSSVKL